MNDNRATFNDFAELLDYSMFVVTARAHDVMGGCLVGFATQASINPPTFLVGLSAPNHTLSVARETSHLGVHVVGRENIELARLFGGQTSHSIDKFDRCAWHLGPAGVPILDAADAWFVGKIIERFDMGDHIGHLLKPTDAHITGRPGTPVSYHDVKNLTPGHQARPSAPAPW